MEARFSHLLQPIRDLTKNWNVDIAAQLEDYLEEIEHVAVSFDGGSTTMNFAEAALLIQGSTSVYSRKVEYLYSLAFQVLDLLASKKKLQQAASVDGQGNDNDTTFANKANRDEEFLTLDDFKEAKSHVLLDENQNTIMIVPSTPLALIKMDGGGKGDHPLMSKTGEVLGNRKDFRLNKSVVHGDGVALLDMSHLCMLEMSFASHPHSTPFPQRGQQKVGDGQNTELNPEPVVTTAVDMPPPEPLHMSNDEDNDVGGFDMPEPMEDTVVPEEQLNTVRKAEAKKKKIKPYLLPRPVPVDDMSESLNPHEAQKVVLKPLKKGKSLRIPQKVQTDAQKGKRNKTQPENNKKDMFQFISNFCSKAKKLPKAQLKAPGLMEFEQLFWAEHFRRHTRVKREHKKLDKQRRVEELQEEEALEKEQADVDELPDGGADDIEDDGIGMPEMEFPDAHDIGPLNFDGDAADLQAENDRHHKNLEGVHSGSVVTSYEDLVMYHVEGFMASAVIYAQTTELARRVQEWEDKIVPRLRQQEEHESFDIHVYGTRILDSVGVNSKKEKEKTGRDPKSIKVPFRKVAEGNVPFQVCRLFLATLQLANNYNIEISCDGSLESGMDTMTLKLLSTKRHFEELEDYQAPSLQTQH